MLDTLCVYLNGHTSAFTYSDVEVSTGTYFVSKEAEGEVI